MEFKIPVFEIQSVLSDMQQNLELNRIVHELDTIIHSSKKKGWGLEPFNQNYRVDYDLNVQWYPIFTFYNVHLANYFIKHIINKT